MPTGPSSSDTPYIEGLEPNVTFTSIITTGDAVAGSTNPDGSSWRFAGIPDGIGAFDNGDGTVTVLVNHELVGTTGVVRDHGSIGSFVSRLTIDSTTLQVTAAEDLAKDIFLAVDATTFVEGTTAFSRLCSGDLAATSAYLSGGVGTDARIYLAGEEIGPEGRAFAFIATGDEIGDTYELPSFGNISYENAVSNPFAQSKTVVMTTDDATPGQVYMYVGEKQATGTVVEKAGLIGGDLYGVTVAGFSDEAIFTGSVVTGVNAIAGGVAAFSMVKLGDDGDVSAMTGAALQADSEAEGVTEFFRPEDGHWDPTNASWFYFVTTASIDLPSRLYRMEFADVANPEAGGVIRVMLDGTEGHKMADNMTVNADGKIIFQEDPGANDRLAVIWQYDPVTDTLNALGEHDGDRFASPATPPFNNNEESSGVIDVADLFGDADTQAYLVDVQAHYLTGDVETVEGGQLLLMTVDTPSNGTSGDDQINGGFTDDNLRGKAGDDDMEGGSGADTLKGNQGADTIAGGSGADRLKGGGGADVFLFGALSDSSTIKGERDVLVGFRQSSGDLIDLSRIDADPTTAGDQAFTFITGEFSGAGGEIRVVGSEGRYVVEVDTGTDGLADMAIAVLTDAAPSAAAFVL